MTERRQTITAFVIPLSIAVMWTGLFWSRAMLSIGMGLFILSAMASGSIREKWNHFKSNPYLWMMSLLFMVPLISGLWSTDKARWLSILQDKFPLLAIPFCSIVLKEIPKNTLRKLIYYGLTIVIVSMLKTLSLFVTRAADLEKIYLEAKVLSADMGNDHVRYGWVLAVVFAWLLHRWMRSTAYTKPHEKKGLLLFAILIAFFLHLVSSRTGLLGSYIAVIMALIFHFRRPVVRNATAMLMMIPLTAWFLIPTFRNRLKFTIWDFQHYTRGGYTEGLSDTPRILSLRAGTAVFSEHPMAGTGFGDLRQSIDIWYGQHAPFMKAYEQLLPSNEALLYAAAAGISGMFVFVLAAILPFFLPTHRRSYLWMTFHAIAVATFLYEIGIETQFGVFIYAFLGCWIYQYCEPVSDIAV